MTTTQATQTGASGATWLPVSEVFGPTFQGEGPYAGRRTGFVRLGLCNLSCEWCDTPYTWDRDRYDVDRECPPTTVAQVHERLAQLNVDTVCLSGGEPLLHHRKLAPLLARPWTWHAETNGTIAPPTYWSCLVEHTSVSPKINTRDPLAKRIKPAALAAWNELAEQGQAAFKFVAKDARDLDSIAEVVERVGIDHRHVYVMPEGVTAAAMLLRHRNLAQGVMDRGWNTTTRLHTLLYGPERGR